MAANCVSMRAALQCQLLLQQHLTALLLRLLQQERLLLLVVTTMIHQTALATVAGMGTAMEMARPSAQAALRMWIQKPTAAQPSHFCPSLKLLVMGLQLAQPQRQPGLQARRPRLHQRVQRQQLLLLRRQAWSTQAQAVRSRPSSSTTRSSGSTSAA